MVASALCFAQTLAICGLWLDGLIRIRNAERRLEDVARETTGMMMLLADLQDQGERQKRWNDLNTQAMQKLADLEKKRHGDPR